uniref:Uncharacterized protein n=1 Tax=uncultured prokaryote TaxID=198431 RepID=A0A0H5Q5M1_9ZZZZ|nr:hypothetical protein [uncultured prokaryote]
MLVIRFGDEIITNSGPQGSSVPQGSPGCYTTKAPKQEPVVSQAAQFTKLIAECESLNASLAAGQWWYLVFKPFDDSYAEYRSFFESGQFPNWCRDKLRAKGDLLYSVEKLASKHHVNMLVYSSHDLTDYHDYSWSGYCKVYATPCFDFGGITEYIFKEAKLRTFLPFVDYYIPKPKAHSAAREPKGEPYASWRPRVIIDWSKVPISSWQPA